jgi:hypothetical protein
MPTSKQPQPQVLGSFNPGECVRVLSGAQHGELDDSNGFANTWVEEMDSRIGSVFTVIKQDEHGVLLNDLADDDDPEFGYAYPPGVLRKVNAQEVRP